LDSIQKKLASHSSGLTILEDQQLKHLQEKSRIFQHQIEEFHRELDEEVRWGIVTLGVPVKTEILFFGLLTMGSFFIPFFFLLFFCSKGNSSTD